MNKTLQDNVWSILPKEFKDEVKRMYKIADSDVDQMIATIMLENVFGLHNLTSDAEGEEELLTVQRSKVIDIFTQNTILLSQGHSEYLSGYYNGKCHVLKDLFGSKCLPDETCNVASKEPNPAEEYDVFNDPEPKCLHFKDGKCAHPAVAHLENGKLVKGADCDVSSCEDVEYEPKPSELKEEADEHFDTIVKGGFRNERRLNIATQITASIYANDEIASRFESIEALVRKALDIAGTLIAECEKGGNHD